MTTLEAMRLYLRDQGDPTRFSDEDLNELYEGTGSVEGATALGWLLVAAELTDAPVSASIGNTSESYGQATERYKVAMAMHQYWKSKISTEYGGGLWLEMVPAYNNGTGGIVAEIIEHQEWIQDQWEDISRLLAFF